jgi:hypothetical protein
VKPTDEIVASELGDVVAVLVVVICKEDAASHICIVCCMALRPSKGASAHDITKTERVFTGDIRMSFELERCAKRVAGMDTQQRADDAGLARRKFRVVLR